MAGGSNFGGRAFGVLLAAVAILTHGASGAKTPPPGKIDDAILKPVIEETRQRFLASKISDLDVHLPPEKAFAFANANEVHDGAARVARGNETKEKFLAEAGKTLEKRQKEIEQVYGEKLANAREFVKKPQNQAELFLLLLTDVTRQLNLPLDQDKPRVTLGKRLQKLYDEDMQRRVAKAKGKGKAPAEHDEAWLTTYEAETAKEVLAALTPEQRQEALRVWPTVFPDGPKADDISR